MRLLTINTHKGFSPWNRRFVLHELRDALRSTSADIVFLQEVTGENQRKAKKHANWPEEPHYAFLAESVWPEHAYGMNMVYRHGHHGNAVLSRYPIVRSEQVDISTNPVEKRGFLHCEMELPDLADPLHCICVHLGLLAVSRRKQLRMLADYVTDCIPRGVPVTIAGDFNDWSGRNVHRFARHLGLNDMFRETRGRTARTYPSWMPVLPLDRIYSRGLRGVASRACRSGTWSKLSDHAGLLAEAVVEASDRGSV